MTIRSLDFRFERTQLFSVLCGSSQRFSAISTSLTQSCFGVLDWLKESISKIWNAFVNCIKSCLGFSSQSSSTSADYEFRLIQDEAQIAQRLQRQMQHAMHQMQHDSNKPFQYSAAPANGHPTAPLNWDVHEERVGGYRIGVSHAQGRRPTMEDEHLATSFNLNIAGRNYPIQLFGIFDGHGGRDAARYVRDNLRNKLQEALVEFNAGNLSDVGIWKALKMTTVRLNRDFKNAYGARSENQGTTATIALILDQKLWTANVGDARTVLDNNGTPIQLTEDAKPSDPRYKRGIVKRGGDVRVHGVPRVNGVLAVARAVGDHGLNGAVSARPKITVKPLSEIQPGSHLILSCDGIYDVARTQDVVNAVHGNRNLSAGTLARNIVYSAYNSGSTDNLSSMVVKIT